MDRVRERFEAWLREHRIDAAVVPDGGAVVYERDGVRTIVELPGHVHRCRTDTGTVAARDFFSPVEMDELRKFVTESTGDVRV